MPRPLLALSLALLLAGPAFGAEEPDPAALIEALAAEEFETRKAAREKLVALGNAAVEALTAANKESDDPEVRVQTTRILQEIAAADRTKASLVTINVDKRPLKEVARAISEQIEGEIEIGNGADDALVSMNLQREPLWKALHEIQVQTRFRIHATGSQGAIGLQLGEGSFNPTAPTSASGPFLFASKNIARYSAIELGENQKARGHVTLNLVVLAEPKVEFVGISSAPFLDRLEDEKGRSLLGGKKNPREIRWSSGIRRTFHHFSMNIPEPQGRVQRLSRVEGRLPVKVLAESARVEVPRILAAEGKTFRSEHWAIEIKEVKWDGNSAVVRIEATLREGVDEKTGPNSLHFEGFTLLDTEGEPFTRSGHGGGGGGNKWSGRVEYHAHGFGGNKKPRARKPAKLIYRYPSRTEVRMIPFSFENLPLP